MIKTKDRRSILCVLITLFFLLGIVASVNDVKLVPQEITHENVQSTMHVQEDEGGNQAPAQLLPIKTIDKMDDFQTRTVRRKGSREMEEEVVTVAVAFMVLAILGLLQAISSERCFSFRRKRIHIFEVIRFIHQIDGKKKSYFA